jgi:hypothetical protein
VSRDGAEVYDTPGTYLVPAAGAPAELYFHRQENLIVYRVPISRSGEVLGCAQEVTELGTSQSPVAIRADGLELVLWGVPGGIGDLWRSTRRNVTEPWSPPENLGPPVNSPFADLTPGLSHDGTTLVFSSGVARGGLGFQDIWISTRTRGR